MAFLVTGCSGFIGYWLCERLLSEGHVVVGLDNMNEYYDVRLKEARLKRLENPQFTFYKMDLIDKHDLEGLFEKYRFDVVIHLAAQAGVRYSITNPDAYIQSNLVGFANILECCRVHAIGHLIYASSSSVYGANTQLPFKVTDNVDHPVSLYAATKKSNELMAHSYSHLYKLPTTGLRFFTVYGPWGRPDMALFHFVKSMIAGESIPVFNHGDMIRDFTYITDIVEGLVRIALTKYESKNLGGKAPYRLYNIGNNNPVRLMDFIQAIEKALGCEAKCDFLEMQPGDVAATHADVHELVEDFNYCPNTSIEDGVGAFVAWYQEYHHVPSF